MRKWTLILLSFIVLQQSVTAQDVVGCAQLLEDAREAYSAGMVELVPELLLPCLESGDLSGQLKQDAYKLVINAYLFDYLPEEADSLMDNFILDFPDYRARAEDPAEFIQLLDSHLKDEGIDPDKVIVTDDDQQNRDEGVRTVSPKAQLKPPFVYRNSMGFILGLNGTIPQIVERYSLGDPALDHGTFGISPAIQLGVAMNLVLNQSTEVAFALQFNRTKFKFTAAPLDFSTYEYEESQTHLHLPVSMIFRLNPETSGAAVYLRVGVMADYLLSASGAGTRSYTQSVKDVVVEKVDISGARASLNLHGLGGFGIRIPMQKAFMFLEARYTSGLFMVNRPEKRYDNQDLIWNLYHVDSDFRTSQVSLVAGMAWNL